MEKETVIVLDFGGQYNQLIARRVRECNVYCEVHPYNISLEKIKEINPKGLFLREGPTAFTRRIHHGTAKRFLTWGFPFWVFAMAPSLWLICWEEA